MLLLALAVSTAFATGGPSTAPTELDCDTMPCGDVLAGAVTFETVEDRPFWQGIDRQGDVIGWVILSTSVVDIPAYSGKPLATLVGLDEDGLITGAKVIHHSEPILLTGIPESALYEFAASYAGRRAIDRVVVGLTSDPDAIPVDVISGATVTALAQNQTVLQSARAIGVMVGVINLADASPGHFAPSEEPWGWDQMSDEELFGRLYVGNDEMGDSRPGAFVDLYFTIVDPPHIGRPLLGRGLYDHMIEQLEPGQHLFVIYGNGTSSFKGSAFVRGGLFDRVRVQQGFSEIMFRDTDYRSLSSPRLAGAPSFNEGAVFITRGGFLDPGRTFELVFLGSRYDGVGGFSREFHEFSSSHRLPRSVYVLDGPDPEEPIWVQAWRNNRFNVVVLAAYLLFVVAVFVGRRWSTADPKRIRRLHIASMIFGVVVVGFALRAQPSVTQLLTLTESLVRDWRWGLFASEPLIFTMWIFIAGVSVYWGRGAFCGWVCPYGALTDLARITAGRLGLPELELPDRIHTRLRYLRYLVLAVLIPVFLYDSMLGELLAEVEPFKSTFFVPLWTRTWPFVVWWIVLAVWSLFAFRPFCRYVCPLGAGLALASSLRPSGPRRRRFCGGCTICTKGCEPKAIRPDGTIDPRECLSCMDCEATYRNNQVCPPLVGIERLLEKRREQELGEREIERLSRLRHEATDV